MTTVIKQVADLKFGDVIMADQLLPRRLFASAQPVKNDAGYFTVMSLDECGVGHSEISGPEGFVVEAVRGVQ